MYLLLAGDTTQLGNVYAIAFLSVMSLFALGNLMLKFKRNELKREVKATWTQTFIALGGVIVALFGWELVAPF